MADYFRRRKAFNDSLSAYSRGRALAQIMDSDDVWTGGGGSASFRSNIYNNPPSVERPIYTAQTGEGFQVYFPNSVAESKYKAYSKAEQNWVDLNSRLIHRTVRDRPNALAWGNQASAFLSSASKATVRPMAFFTTEGMYPLPIWRRPIQRVLPPAETSKMNVIHPSAPNPEIPVPISSPSQRSEVPKYIFKPGFVDEKVASSANQPAADDELLTKEQLEYRRRTKQKKVKPLKI